MVLDVKVVGAGLRIGILDQVGKRRNRGVTFAVGEVIDISGGDRLGIGTAPAHRELMVVVVDRIVPGQ